MTFGSDTMRLTPTEYITRLQGVPSSSGIACRKQLVHPSKQHPSSIMSAITQGVKDFLKGSHKPDSTEVSFDTLAGRSIANQAQVCSEVAPEVVEEHVRPKENTETAEAVDKERHIHHHQVSLLDSGR